MQRLAASADRQTEEADPTAKQAPQLKPPRGYGQTDAASRVPQPRLRSQEVYLNPQVSAYIRFRVNQALREYQRYQNQRYHRYHKGYPHYHHR
jgi:hypothetical protein